MTSRIQYKTAEMAEWSSFHPIMSILSYLINLTLEYRGKHPLDGIHFFRVR